MLPYHSHESLGLHVHHVFEASQLRSSCCSGHKTCRSLSPLLGTGRCLVCEFLANRSPGPRICHLGSEFTSKKVLVANTPPPFPADCLGISKPGYRHVCEAILRTDGRNRPHFCCMGPDSLSSESSPCFCLWSQDLNSPRRPHHAVACLRLTMVLITSNNCLLPSDPSQRP